MHIETSRLVLLRTSGDILRADLEGAEALASALGVAVSREWPPSSEYDGDAIRYMIALLEREPAAYDWGFRYIMRKEPAPTVIGAGGYTGPAKDGAIEIGYSICPSERRRGFATETTRALRDCAFRHSDVERVIAHTLPELTPSIGVLENCGFTHVGDGGEAGTIKFAIERADWIAHS
jgi:[ribosomal protein S5]-alanine N-acetyltransferase